MTKVEPVGHCHWTRHDKSDLEQTFTTSFTWDSFGRMMSITYPDGERVDYVYDAGGLLESATGHRTGATAEPGDEVYLASMTYDEFGQRVRMVLGNGVTSTYRYEPLTRRLRTLTTITPLRRTIQAITYGYDRVGNIRTMVNALGQPVGDRSGAVRYEYGYDDLYRLTYAHGEAQSRAHTIDRFTATYAYSDIHNMTANVQVHEIVHGGAEIGQERPPKTNHAFAYQYDPAHPHRATKIGDTFLVYDGNGNTVRECRDHGDPTCSTTADHLRRYEWTEENRLDRVIDGGGRNVTRFLYDAAGDRVVKLGRGGESITIGQFWALKGRRAATKHVFAGATRVASKLLPPPGWDTESGSELTRIVVASTVGDGSPNDTGCDPSNYVPQKCPALPGGEPEINHQYDDTRVRAETYYYHPDHLGSTSWITDQHARVHEHVEYFPYGEVWRDPRSDSDGGPVKGQRFLFTGKEFDEETGLHYFGARYYQPEKSRWLTPDPLLEGALGTTLVAPATLSVYAYTFGNPIRHVDPDGNAGKVASDVADDFERDYGSYVEWAASRATPEMGLGEKIGLATLTTAVAVGKAMVDSTLRIGEDAAANGAAGWARDGVRSLGAGLMAWGIAKAGISPPTVQNKGPASRPVTAKSAAEARAEVLRNTMSKRSQPTMVSAAIDLRTGKVYFGQSGGRTSSVIDDLLRERMPQQSLARHGMPASNCAEFQSCNSALLGGAKLENLEVHTVVTRTGQAASRCPNCQVTTAGAKVTSD